MPTHENTPYPAVALQHPAQWMHHPNKLARDSQTGKLVLCPA